MFLDLDLDLTVQHGKYWHRTTQHGVPTSERVWCSLSKAELRQHKVNAGCANLGYPPHIFTWTICAQPVVEHSELILILSATVGHTEISLYHDDVTLVLFEDKGQQPPV